MATVTTDRLRKKFAEVTQELIEFPTTNNGATTSSTTNTTSNTGTELTIEQITKVQGDYLITSKGTKAKLFSPMPCLYWKCTGATGKDGIISLKKPLDGLFIHNGTDSYCLGVTGSSDEFEVRFHVGSNEVRVNNMWLNIAANHIIKNGLEIE